MEPIAVLAGTPVDTQMGVDVLSAAGLSGAPFPISPDPREQTAFQISSPAEKHRTALAILNRAQAQGCRKAFVYCNSLSASVDFDALARETGMRIVTPLQRASSGSCWMPIRAWTPSALPRCRWSWPSRRGCRRRSWCSAIAWRNWQIGSPIAAWRRCCWAAPTSPTSKRRWPGGQAFPSLTRQPRCWSFCARRKGERAPGLPFPSAYAGRELFSPSRWGNLANWHILW